MSREFKQINSTLFPLKLSENCRFSDIDVSDLSGNRS